MLIKVILNLKPGFHVNRNCRKPAVSQTGGTLGHAGSSSIFNGNILFRHLEWPGGTMSPVLEKLSWVQLFPAYGTTGLQQLRGSYGYMETRLKSIKIYIENSLGPKINLTFVSWW